MFDHAMPTTKNTGAKKARFWLDKEGGGNGKKPETELQDENERKLKTQNTAQQTPITTGNY